MAALPKVVAAPALAAAGLSTDAWTTLLENDRALARVGKRIRVLKAIDWPSALEERFLAGWRAGAPRLPEPPPPPPPPVAELATLLELMQRIDRGHPLGNWQYKSAWSYAVAARMLAAIGTPEFSRCSALLYGRPDVRYRSQEVCNADGAAQIIAITDELVGDARLPPIPCDIPAPEFAERMRERLAPVFTDDAVQVVLDPGLASKATAGGKQVTLRASALFSERDLEQLVQHEAFVHTLTAVNGRRQPYLSVFGLGTPRTTRTQEGLATFAEIITGAIDLARLRRVALRVVMVKRALDGADFIDVFRGFLDAGQTEVESYRSAARVFRGGDPRGGICFTKDGAYLEGVMMVNLFIRRALHDGRADLLRMLFAGRLTLGDAVALAPLLDTGLIAPSYYVPPWARDPHRVLAIMAFSTAAQAYRIDTVQLQRFADYEDEVIGEAGFDA